ncbi:hypothetical protein FE36_19995 [Xanthomonas oryzae pv. oryzicola]|uniref:M48 family metalloprotease n=1 Tax=Xanthomonas oryzae TaxID=347 RepID=UPI0006436EA9|nr:M48 family metalloprotease [Xanthomonas oryzae]AKK65887.1 hypothetical protein FE36_19995 [Xanthomonas oryzae pv. oryzicola]
MSAATHRQLQRLVDEIAAHGDIVPPRVRLWRHRNARYNALTHTIAVSRTLAHTLDANQRYTLLAHEVGHAQRRATMLARAGSYFWPPALALGVGGLAAAAVYSLAARPVAITDPHALCALMLCTVAAVIAGQLAERIARRTRRDGYAEELRADRFANRLVGDPTAMTSVLHACAQIEDRGELTSEDKRRIAFAQRGPGQAHVS